MNWTLLPSTGSPGGGFSGFLSTMGVSDFSSPFPLRFVSFARRYLTCASCSCSRWGSCAFDARHAQASSLGAVRPTLRVRGETTRSPRFLGCLRARAPFFDPGGASGPMILGPSGCCLPPSQRRRPPTTSPYFGAQSRGPCTRCLRFAAALTGRPRKTRFRLVISLCRTACLQGAGPLGTSESFRDVHPPLIASPFPRLGLAHCDPAWWCMIPLPRSVAGPRRAIEC